MQVNKKTRARDGCKLIKNKSQDGCRSRKKSRARDGCRLRKNMNQGWMWLIRKKTRARNGLKLTEDEIQINSFLFQ